MGEEYGADKASQVMAHNFQKRGGGWTYLREMVEATDRVRGQKNRESSMKEAARKRKKMGLE